MMHAKQDERTFLQRWLPHPLLTAALVVLWMLLLNDFSAGGLIVGIILGMSISILTSQFWPDRPHVRSWGKALEFMLIVAWDVIVANVIVAKLILFCPVKELNTRWVTVPIELKTPEAIAILAGTITMTPGTVSSDISADGRSLLVHCLDAPDAEIAVREMKARYEARLMEIFG
jgi:multicomponent K+:H+ antiporter subunit E